MEAHFHSLALHLRSRSRVSHALSATDILLLRSDKVLDSSSRQLRSPQVRIPGGSPIYISFLRRIIDLMATAADHRHGAFHHHEVRRPSITGGRAVCNPSRSGPCHYLGSEAKVADHSSSRRQPVWRRNPPPSKGHGCPSKPNSSAPSEATAAMPPPPAPERVCEGFLEGTCPGSSGEQCPNGGLHSWIISHNYCLLTPLHGHHKAITGIVRPSGSDKLYSGSQDETVREWDCHTGECIAIVPLGGPAGCVASADPWLLVGIPGAIRVWNTQTGDHFTLNAASAGSTSKRGGQVYALVEGNGFLFAGTQSNGDILSWKLPDPSSSSTAAEAANFVAAPPLTGHQRAVVSLTVGHTRRLLYSGSIDTTIRVWDLTTMRCLQTLTQHTHVVTSLICWDNYLLSCSLDQTIRVWGAPAAVESLQLIHTRTEEDGLLALHCIRDVTQQGNHVLLCSCNDNTVSIYSMPSFKPVGKIFSKKEVRAIGIIEPLVGQFFTGDASGDLKVWNPILPANLDSNSSTTSSS